MGRDDTGKKQEEAKLAADQQKQAADLAARDKATADWKANLDKLAANPGYTPEEMAAQRAEQSGQIHSVYGSAEQQLENHAARTGSINDVGLAPQVAGLARERGMADAAGTNSIAGKNADASLTTRRMLPQQYQFAPGLYQGSISGLGQQETSAIGSRMDADSKPTFLQSMALAGIQGASQVGAAAAGKPPCWIAEALYGVDDARTHLIRWWILNVYSKTPAGSVVTRLYCRFGERVALFLSRNRIVKGLAQTLFDRFLREAQSCHLAFRQEAM